MVDASYLMLTVAHISVKILRGWLGVLLDLFYVGVDVSTDLLLDVLELSLGSPAVLKEKLADDFNEVAMSAHIIDFLTGSVGNIGVRHGVTVVSIGA